MVNIMQKVLLTGSTGFVGKNIYPLLKDKYHIVAPTRQELDLKNTEAVYEYIEKGKFDTVIHSANPNPVKNALDNGDTMFEDSMRIFMNFYKARNLCGKLLYLGSGAEYDKSLEIVSIKEEEADRSIPKEYYGFSKYIMNELARGSNNVYNLRLFGCYGPYDHESKFITHAIRCCMRAEDITIRQNCYFDYMHVFDIAKVISWFIENNPKYHDYNVCSGKRISLKEIAEKVKEQMNSPKSVIILNDGFNREYTASNARLINEMIDTDSWIGIDEGIAMQIQWEKEN